MYEEVMETWQCVQAQHNIYIIAKYVAQKHLASSILQLHILLLILHPFFFPHIFFSFQRTKTNIITTKLENYCTINVVFL